MATIRKRMTKAGQVRYQALVRRGDHSATKSFTRKRDAEAWAASMESDMLSGRYRPGPETKTLRQALERYWLEVSPTKKGAKQDGSRLKMIGTAPFADKLLPDIEPEEIARWRNDRLKVAANNTVRNDLVLLSSVFEMCRKEWRLTHTNPAKDVRWPPAPRGRERRVSREEENVLLAHCDTVQRALVVVLLETGMRLSEALSLRLPGNLDLEARLVYLEDTKNGTRRSVPLSTRAVQALKTVPVDLHTGKLFPWSASLWGHHWERIRAKAGIEDIRTHDLRHEAVSRLFEKGLNVMEVATISGHKTLAMLQRYTHLKAESLLDRLDP